MAGHSSASPAFIPRSRARWPLPAAAGLSVLGAVAWLWLEDPHDGLAAVPACPIKAITGLLCPGCGGLRATWHLLHGDLGGAWADNPALFVLLPALAAGFIVWALAQLRAAPTPRLPLPAVIAVAVLGGVWMLARNAILTT
jgi:hypothetical protein